MIIPMTKYSMLVHYKDKDRFMQKLMDLGLVQVHGFITDGDEYTQQLASNIRETEEVIKRFRRRDTRYPSRPASIIPTELPSLASIAAMEKDLDQALNQVEALNLKIDLLLPWGEFNWDDIQALESRSGMEVRYFQYPERHFNLQWQVDFPLQIINRVDGMLYFIIYSSSGQELPLAPIALPRLSLSLLKRQKQALLEKIDQLNGKLNDLSVHLVKGLGDRLNEAEDLLQLHRAGSALIPLKDEKLWVINAWCPQTSEARLLDFLAHEVVVYEKIDTHTVDPPVLLRNNWFTRLFEPIGRMFSLPKYSELDLTIFFAPFFLLFFGLCLGDVGYGIVILVIASLLKFKLSRDTHDYLSLAQLFGISTIIAGIISGVFFGVEMAYSEYFAGFRGIFLQQDQLFKLALAIGFVQIILGMSIQVYKRWKFKGFIFAISKLGWVLLLISLGDLYITQIVPHLSWFSVWLSLILIVFFNAPEKRWFLSLGLGLADLYNITGILGDLLSYIRLFALGVSSAILGLVVNSMAYSAKELPYVGVLLFIIVLLVGHTANLLLSTLSAFVHPMRLTFVEFYKNSAFEGGGKPFIPFARNHSKKMNV